MLKKAVYANTETLNQEPEGIPKRLVLVAFFAIVLVCALFFSLGFILGRWERNPGNAPATEQVTPSSDIPPTVNPPAGPPQPSTASEESGGAAAPATGSPAPSSTVPEHPQASAQTELPAPSATGAAKPRDNAPSSSAARQLMGEASNGHQTSTAAVPVRTKLPPGLTVQVAALSSQQDAVNMVQVLKSRGYPALLLTPDREHSKDIFYRIIVGPYKTRQQVDEARNKLAAEGFKPFIRQ